MDSELSPLHVAAVGVSPSVRAARGCRRHRVIWTGAHTQRKLLTWGVWLGAHPIVSAPPAVCVCPIPRGQRRAGIAQSFIQSSAWPLYPPFSLDQILAKSRGHISVLGQFY